MSLLAVFSFYFFVQLRAKEHKPVALKQPQLTRAKKEEERSDARRCVGNRVTVLESKFQIITQNFPSHFEISKISIIG